MQAGRLERHSDTPRTWNTSQLTASLDSRCAKNFATFRSLFVSSRWISEYCSQTGKSISLT